MVLPDTKRYDMLKKPKKQAWYLTPLAWLLSLPVLWKHKLKINKQGMEKLKPPYVLLSTHHAFVDFKVTTMAIFPHRANYIVAIDGFIGREGLLRNVGCVCKRKFTNDILLVRQIEHCIRVNKSICAIYPEARYSLCGTTAILPDSLGKMCKMLGVPVVVLNMHGNYLSSPVWSLRPQKVALAADMTQIVRQEEIKELAVDDINQRIAKAFQYDEYQYLLDTHQIITHPKRAEGLHRILYQCPMCLTEHEMDSSGETLFCRHCHKTWIMEETGQLRATSGKTEYSHIPDWYEFEREQVRQSLENHTYGFEDDVTIDALPNAQGYVRLGDGHLLHDDSGFRLTAFIDGQEFLLEKDPLSLYSLHIEYDYLGKGADCIDLSTLSDTYYIYPKTKKNVVTKLHFAVEEMYKIAKQKKLEEISNRKSQKEKSDLTDKN